jgi:hypothetical protein|nr:MAG TPA: hypothetical protein [Caudoviricetes sp.]
MYIANKMTSLAEFDRYFYNIAHAYKNITYDSSEVATKWEQVDDRFHSFYGSTYEVPLEHIKKRTWSIKVAIVGDKWLMSENILHKTASYDRTMKECTEVIEPIRYYSIKDEIKDIFPNAIIDVVGDYSNTAIELNTLDKIINYVKAHKDIDYLICNTTQPIRSKLKELDNLCSENNIKCFIATSVTDTLTNFIPHIKEVRYNDYEMLLFDIAEYVYKHINIVKFKCHVNGTYTGDKIESECGWLYKTAIDEPLSQKYFEHYFIKTKDVTVRYTEFLYNKMKRYIIENLFGIKNNSYYITFNHYFIGSDINDTIYAKYFGVFAKYPMDGKINKDAYEMKDSHGKFSYVSKYCDDEMHWNLFKNSGEFITVSVSLGFSEHLYSCEYFGATGYHEWMTATDDDGVFCNLLKIRKWCPGGGHEVQLIPPPVFQGTGCPWFVITEGNKEQYKNRYDIKCPIEFIIKRDDMSASVIMHLDKTNSGEKEIYSAISFGRFEPSHREKNDRCSLYIAGGTTGLANDIYVYSPGGSGCPTYITGNVYDLNIQNIAMSNSDIVNPTQFYDAKWSNFKVLCEDSKWRSIYSLTQGAEVVPYPVCGGCTPTFATRLNPPSDFTPDFMITKNPMSQKKRFFINTKKRYNNIKKETRTYNIQLDDIVVVANGINVANYVIGTIPNIYIHYDYMMPLGIIHLNDGTYLNLPCVWDERLYHYKINLDVINDEWEPLATVEEYEKQKMNEKANKILYRTLIRLGD